MDQNWILSGFRLKQVRKDLARPTNLHLLIPVFLNSAVTNCSVYEPAKLSNLKLPCRAVCFLVRRTFFYSPTRFSALPFLSDPGEQEIHLSLRRRWNEPPALFVTLNCLNRNSEQQCHLFLCFVQFLAEVDELFAVHRVLLRPKYLNRITKG